MTGVVDLYKKNVCIYIYKYIYIYIYCFLTISLTGKVSLPL